MKKTIINISLVLAAIIVYFLQANFFSWFNIAGIMPNIFVIFILFIGLFSNRTMGTIYGLVVGLLLDLIIGTKVGINVIGLGLIGFLAAIFDKNFSKDSRITIMVMSVAATAIFEILSYFLSYVLIGTNLEIINFVKILVIEIIFNLIITIIIYPLIQKSGYAHLIEHMIIQANKKYLTYLEKQGIQFNAETKDCMTEYIFIDLQSELLLDELKEGNLEKIFDTGFKEEALAIERGTIAQEHLLLSNQMDEADVSEMIGNREEIANFKLARADTIKKGIYSKYHTRGIIQYKSNAYHHYYLLLTSFKYLCNEVTYVTQHLVNNIDIEKVYMSGNWEEKLCEKIDNQK